MDCKMGERDLTCKVHRGMTMKWVMRSRLDNLLCQKIQTKIRSKIRALIKPLITGKIRTWSIRSKPDAKMKAMRPRNLDNLL